MRVLVVDEEIPYPLNSGKRLRTYNLLKHLAGKHQITFICRQHEGGEDVQAEPFEKIGIEVRIIKDPILKKSGLQFYAALLMNIISRYPYTVKSHYSNILENKIDELLAAHKFDLIHCEWTPYGINLRPFLGKYPTIVDAHNVEAVIWKRNFEIEKNFPKKAYIYLQWKKMQSYEQQFFPKFSRCVAVSAPDADVISEFTEPGKVDIVSNGVDISYFSQERFENKSITKKHDLVFTGSLDWRPNIDGILYFLNEIFPSFKKRYPKSVCHIIGRNPQPGLKDKVAMFDNVNLVGMVDDVRPYMNRDAVYIVPLRVGGGSRLKILEAFAMEMPVVSTSIGAEGLDVIDEENIRLADTPEKFVDSIGDIINNEIASKAMAQKGRSLVEEKYQWKVLADRLERSWLDAYSEFVE